MALPNCEDSEEVEAPGDARAGILVDSQAFPRIFEDSRGFSEIPEDSERFSEISRDSQIFFDEK